MIISSIGQGMLWSILGLGIFMTYRILGFPDMTTEGSFPWAVRSASRPSRKASTRYSPRCWASGRACAPGS